MANPFRKNDSVCVHLLRHDLITLTTQWFSATIVQPSVGHRRGSGGTAVVNIRGEDSMFASEIACNWNRRESDQKQRDRRHPPNAEKFCRHKNLLDNAERERRGMAPMDISERYRHRVQLVKRGFNTEVAWDNIKKRPATGCDAIAAVAAGGGGGAVAAGGGGGAVAAGGGGAVAAGGGGAVAAGGGGSCVGGDFICGREQRVNFLVLLEAHGIQSDVGARTRFTPSEVAPNLGGLGFTCKQGNKGLQHRDPTILCDPRLLKLHGTQDFVHLQEKMEDYLLSCECPNLEYDDETDGFVPLHAACKQQGCNQPACKYPYSQEGCYKEGIKLCVLDKGGRGIAHKPPFEILPLQDLIKQGVRQVTKVERGEVVKTGRFLLSHVLAFIDQHIREYYGRAIEKHNTTYPKEQQISAVVDGFKYGVIVNICRRGFDAAEDVDRLCMGGMCNPYLIRGASAIKASGRARVITPHHPMPAAAAAAAPVAGGGGGDDDDEADDGGWMSPDDDGYASLDEDEDDEEEVVGGTPIQPSRTLSPKRGIVFHARSKGHNAPTTRTSRRREAAAAAARARRRTRSGIGSGGIMVRSSNPSPAARDALHARVRGNLDQLSEKTATKKAWYNIRGGGRRRRTHRRKRTHKRKRKRRRTRRMKNRRKRRRTKRRKGNSRK